MNKIEIVGEKREALGKSFSKKLRFEGKVPAVLYGGDKPIHFSLEAKKLNAVIYTADVFFIELSIEGKKYNSILQDIQIHPLNDKFIHADFFLIQEDKPLKMEIPVKLEGTAQGVLMGGNLKLKYNKMKVSGLPNALPQYIHIDISKLDIGDNVRVKEIEIPNVELLHPPDDSIVSVRTSRLAQNIEDEEEAEVQVGEEETEESAQE